MAGVWVAAIGQIATIAVTWPLWQSRSSPPVLPAISFLGGLDWGVVLVLAAGSAIVRPRVGGPAFAVLFGAAVLGDWTRLQPECVSLALLMAALPFGRTGLAVARWHLVALWWWSGLNKALSLGWPDGDAAFISSALRVDSWRPLIAVGLPAAEVGLGVLAVFRRARVASAIGAAALHVGIFLTLSPLFANWNSAVWPWNLALAVAAPLTLLADRGPSEDRPASRRAAWTVRFAAAVLTLSPVLFYVGRIDTYLAHNLYTGNAATATICDAAGGCVPAPFDTWIALNVPLPPEPRLFRQWFALVCTPGQTLVHTGVRTRVTDAGDSAPFACPPRARATAAPGPGTGGGIGP